MTERLGIGLVLLVIAVLFAIFLMSIALFGASRH